jgi:hypothetical protein
MMGTGDIRSQSTLQMEHIVRHVFEFSFLLGLKATGFGAFSLGAWGSPRSRKNRSRNSFLLYQEIKTDDLNPRILEHHWCCRLFFCIH